MGGLPSANRFCRERCRTRSAGRPEFGKPRGSGGKRRVMHLTVVSAPDSWGVWFSEDARQTPWYRFLDEIAEAGYEWMELGPFGYLPTDPDVLKPELDKR